MRVSAEADAQVESAMIDHHGRRRNQRNQRRACVETENRMCVYRLGMAAARMVWRARGKLEGRGGPDDKCF